MCAAPHANFAMSTDRRRFARNRRPRINDGFWGDSIDIDFGSNIDRLRRQNVDAFLNQFIDDVDVSIHCHCCEPLISFPSL